MLAHRCPCILDAIRRFSPEGSVEHVAGVIRVVAACEVVEGFEGDDAVVHGLDVLGARFIRGGAELPDLLFGGEFGVRAGCRGGHGMRR